MPISMRRVLGVVVAVAVVAAACDENGIRAQISPSASSTVVIAAVELQFEDPMPGGQGVWIVNRAVRDQDVSCWTIHAASSGARAVIANGTQVSRGRGLRFATPGGMLRSRDTVTLFDRSGREVSRTPELVDTAGDDQAWYQLPGEAWRFGRVRLTESISDGRLVPAC